MRLNIFSKDSIDFEEFDEQFDLFIKGKMSPDEESKFKSKIKSDPELKERARTLSYLIKNINIVGEEKDKNIVSAFSNFSSEDEVRKVLRTMKDKEKKIKFHNIVKWSSSVAAIPIIGLLIGIPYLKSYQAVSLADRYYTEYDISINLRGNKDMSVENELATLIDNIKKKSDLKQTLSRLEELYNRSISDEYNDYTNHSTTIAWYLALSYLKDNQKEKSIAILDKLIKENPESAIGKMAEKLKKDIIDL